MTKKHSIFILLAILLIAGFMRFYNLSETPPGLYPDEAMNANDAFDNPGQPFYSENGGREGLYVNLIAVNFELLGASVYSLRLTSAIIGAITVLGLYLLTKSLFKNKEKLALVSAFLLAVSFWHINFSRIGFRGVLLPCLLVFCFYYLTKAFEMNKWIYFVGSAIFLGLGFYSYSSYRMAFLIFLVLFVIYFILSLKKKELKKFLINTFCFGLTLLIVAYPLIHYFLTHPGTFFGRLGQVSIFSQPNPIKAFLISSISHLAMFNIVGDFNWRHNLSGSPQLLIPVGILFLIGFVICFLGLIKAHRRKNYPELLKYYLLFSWFFSMLLPGALTYEGLPHSLRTIGVIPVCYIFAGIGAICVFGKIKKLKLFSQNRIAAPLLIVLAAAVLFSWQFYKYFYVFAGSDNLQNAFTTNFKSIGDYLNKADDMKKYVVVNVSGTPVPFPDGPATPAQTPIFIEKTGHSGIRTVYLKPENVGSINNEEMAVIIPMEANETIMGQLKELSPQYQIVEFEYSNKAVIINP